MTLSEVIRYRSESNERSPGTTLAITLPDDDFNELLAECLDAFPYLWTEDGRGYTPTDPSTISPNRVYLYGVEIIRATRPT